MSRAAQIDWWQSQVEATRRAVSDARGERQRLRPAGLLDDAPRARQTRATPPMEAPAAQQGLRGSTITGGQDEERRRGLAIASGGGGAAATGGFERKPMDQPVEGGVSGGGQRGGAL